MRESNSALWRREREVVHRGPSAQVPAASPALVEVLWRRRLTVVIGAALALTAGSVYLAFAPRVYRATATVMVVQGAPKALSEVAGREPDSDVYLQTQADIIRSS